jgi:hypothetical protein
MAQYNSGIYKKGKGIREVDLGLRALKIIGWNTDSTTNKRYWIAANTFSQNWGVNGIINIFQDDSSIISYYQIIPQ